MQRLDFAKASPAAYKALLGVENYLRESGLEHSLLELVKLRASQINGCGYCVDMHAKDARAAGESERRLYAVAVWRETPFFSPRERAALAWTEALTRLSRQPALEADFAALKEHFSEREMVDLGLAISAINSWNRLAVGFGLQPAV
ncbi:Alkyl hydroperoxide reductase AhpD [Massilia sp. Bi118]|uniref:carboxymuconolactone decarboxylase family protein n=1 Tax=Massilia sp. Bi118 TaxID=2822346 RepID=UPI001D780D1A|nr:carboxymuconolactone decarboxylase family protein [Massilia sp. Bi118]CAH0311759.1 Alkyl hydroperoxide reductase AhpD [Massilia sp. Bi118]